MKTFVAIAGATIILMAVFLTVQHQAQMKLQQQNDTLQKQADQLAQLKTENQQLADQLAQTKKSEETAEKQLSELSNKQTQKQKPVQTSASSDSSAASAAAKVEEKELSKDSWSKSGFAFPEDTLKTRGWAVLNGDQDAFKQSIYITDDARKFAEDQFIKMAEASNDPNKAQYIQDILNNKMGVDEAILMPMMAANQNNPFTGYKILSEKSPSADEMILQVETETASAPAQTETLDFQRFGSDWKIVYDKATIQNMMQSH